MRGWNPPVGLRWAPWDLPLLLATAVATILLARPLPAMAWLIATVVGHFFLFCNVFRVRRALELGWGVVFVGNVALFAWMGRLDGALILLAQLPVSALVILLQVRSPWYRGIFAVARHPDYENRAGVKKVHPKIDKI